MIDPEMLAWLQALNFNPYIAAFDVLWYALGLPSPFKIFMQIFDDLFGGRPKLGPDSATDNTALALLHSKDPIVKQWGKGIRILERQGYPTSVSGGIGQQRYGSLNLAMKNALVRQMPQMVKQHNKLITAGQRAHEAYVYAAFNRECSDSRLSAGCRAWINRIDKAWYIPLVLQGNPPPPPPPPPGQNNRPCACQAASTGGFPEIGINLPGGAIIGPSPLPPSTGKLTLPPPSPLPTVPPVLLPATMTPPPAAIPAAPPPSPPPPLLPPVTIVPTSTVTPTLTTLKRSIF
jgi:hypothetical protein